MDRKMQQTKKNLNQAFETIELLRKVALNYPFRRMHPKLTLQEIKIW